MNRITMRIAILFTALSLMGGRLVLAAALPQDIYKEAQLKENIARDSDAAIRLYEEFLAQKETPRKLQADAYLHIGICQSKLGHAESAKTAWTKIVQDYSDQSESYAEALTQLQNLQLAEGEAARNKPPVEKIVYAPPASRWTVDFPRFTFNETLDGKNEMIDMGGGGSIGFTYFLVPQIGVNLEVGSVGGNLYTPSFPTTKSVDVRRDINYVMPLLRAETPFWGPIAMYGKTGIGVYDFKFKGHVTDMNDFSSHEFEDSKWTGGLMLEGGVILGWYRGINFTVGYTLHALGQVTPSQEFLDQLPADARHNFEDITQNRGFRLVGGPTIGLAFRW